MSHDFDLDNPFAACLLGDTPAAIAKGALCFIGLGFGLALLFYGLGSALFNLGAFQPLAGMGVAMLGSLIVYHSLTTPY